MSTIVFLSLLTVGVAMAAAAWLSRLLARVMTTAPARVSRKLVTGGLAGTCALMMGAGVGLERAYDVSGTVEGAWLEASSDFDALPYKVEGDPSLAMWARQVQPALARPPFDDGAAFTEWQRQLRTALSKRLFDSSMISLPGQVQVREVSRTTLSGQITRVFLDFESFDGTRIPAVLFLPPGTGRRAAVVVVPGHGADGIRATAGDSQSYQHGAALRLAREGYVTLTFELRGFGLLGARVNAEHRIVAYNAILAGSSYKGVVLRDMKRAVDLLVARPEVDERRLGVAGASLGGEVAVTYAAMDLRVTAVVVHAYGGSVGPTPGEGGSSQADQPHYCHTIPGQNRLMHEEDVFLLVAPRPLLVVRGSRDAALQPPFQSVLRRAYGMSGAERSLTLRTLSGGHEFFVAPTVEFLSGTFGTPQMSWSSEPGALARQMERVW